MAEYDTDVNDKVKPDNRLSEDILIDFKDTSCFQVKQLVHKRLEQPQFQVRKKALELYENKILEASKNVSWLAHIFLRLFDVFWGVHFEQKKKLEMELEDLHEEVIFQMKSANSLISLAKEALDQL